MKKFLSIIVIASTIIGVVAMAFGYDAVGICAMFPLVASSIKYDLKMR